MVDSKSEEPTVSVEIPRELLSKIQRTEKQLQGYEARKSYTALYFARTEELEGLYTKLVGAVLDRTPDLR